MVGLVAQERVQQIIEHVVDMPLPVRHTLKETVR